VLYELELRSRRSRGPVISDGTTHILQHFPPIPGMTGPEGTWILRTAADFTSQATFSGADVGWEHAGDVPEGVLVAFAARQLRHRVTLTRFEVTVEGPGGVLIAAAEPAFYVTPA
jgi:hypothetical protein